MRWRGYKCKNKDAGSPIRSGMTQGEESVPEIFNGYSGRCHGPFRDEGDAFPR